MEVLDFGMQGMKINNLTQRTIVNLGGKGSGKTTLLKMFISELPDRMPAIIFDPLDVISIPKIKSINIHRKNIMDGKKAGVLVYEQFILKKKKVIIKFINLLGLEIKEFMDVFIPEVAKMKHGCFIFDEMQEFTPEMGLGSGSYSLEVERMVKSTRNKDNRVWFNSQRPAFVSKRVLALGDFFILFRLSYPNDMDVVKRLSNDKNISTKLQNKGFLEGYTINFDPTSGKYINKKPVKILQSAKD